MHLQGLLGLADRFVAPSRFLADRYCRWGLEPARIETIANGAPPVASTQNTDGTELRHHFAFFGNITPHKGVLPLLVAAARAQAARPELRVSLHGALQFPEPSFRSAFEAALAAAPGVRWTRGYDRQEIGRLMADTGWVVVPSLWWENAPLVVLEAFRYGRPVIASGIGGMAELIQHEVSGLHVPIGDTTSLAAALLRASSEPGLWERLRRGRPEVATYDEVADIHLDLYQTLRTRSHRQLVKT